MDFSSKVILITGAAQGLGKVVSKKLNSSGASLALVDVDAKSLGELECDLGEERSKTYTCDVSKLDQVTKTIDQIMKDFGRVDILINNAGIWTDDELEKSKPELRQRALEVNVLGHIQVIDECMSYFKKQDSAHIVEIISTSGISDLKDGDNSLWKTYGASKWAMRGYINALKKSLEGTGINITSFFPGGFESNLYENANRENPHNQPWMMNTEDVADTLLFCVTRPADVHIDSMVVTKKPLIN